LRFQAVIFQAILESLNIKKTDKLLVHGTILDKSGKKMSKTLGNVVDPFEQLDKYGLDAVRYYALAGLNTYSDSGWSETELVNLFNSDICNDWGNLISRTLHLCDTKSVEIKVQDNPFKIEIDKRVEEVNQLWSEFRIKEALVKTNQIVKYANGYINDTQPWSKIHNPEITTEILNNLHYLISEVNKLYLPVFPGLYPTIVVALNELKKVILFEKLI
jgi:methionyl-tRNA synthetase